MNKYDIAAPGTLDCGVRRRHGVAIYARVYGIECGVFGIVRVLHFSFPEAKELAREYAAARLSEFAEEAISVEEALLAGML